MLIEKLKEFLKDAGFYGLSNVLGQLIGFFLIPLYTAYLTPDDYGVLTLLGFYTLFYSPLSHLGLHGAMFRYVGFSKSVEEERNIISTALKAVVIISIFITGISFLFLKSLETLFIDSTDYTNLFILTVITAFFSSLAQFAIAYLRIKRKVKSIFWINIGNLTFSVLLNIILIVVFKLGLNGIVITNAIAALLFSIAVFVVSRLPFDFSFDWGRLKKLLSYGLPNVPHYLQATVMIMFGQFYLNKMLDASDLGLYAVAWKFCLPFQAIMGIIQSSWSAYKFDLYRNYSEPKKMINQFTLIMSLVFIGLYFITVLTGPKLLVLMTAAKYHQAKDLLPILALIPLFNSHYFIFNTGVAFGKHQYYVPVISFTGTIATVLLSIWGIPLYGAVAAALATSAGWFVMCFGTYLYGQHNYKLKFRFDVILSGILLCVIFGFWVYVNQPSLIYQLLIFLGITAFVLFTFRGIVDRTLKMFLRS